MNQNEQVLIRLRRGPLTPLEAFRDPDIRTLRLAARIYDLRVRGHEITEERVSYGGKLVARYTLIKEQR